MRSWFCEYYYYYGRFSYSDKLGIISKRIDKVPGTHVVTYENEIDEIYIKHTAHNRKGFALGAVLASEFMNGKSGFYGMSDLLGL